MMIQMDNTDVNLTVKEMKYLWDLLMRGGRSNDLDLIEKLRASIDYCEEMDSMDFGDCESCKL
jgi:hypothetical protein